MYHPRNSIKSSNFSFDFTKKGQFNEINAFRLELHIVPVSRNFLQCAYFMYSIHWVFFSFHGKNLKTDFTKYLIHKNQDDIMKCLYKLSKGLSKFRLLYGMRIEENSNF